jgi:hypothetical protein
VRLKVYPTNTWESQSSDTHSPFGVLKQPKQATPKTPATKKKDKWYKSGQIIENNQSVGIQKRYLDLNSSIV